MSAVREPKMSRESTSRPKERSEEHTSELQSRLHLVCRLLLEKKKHHRVKYAPRVGAERPTDRLDALKPLEELSERGELYPRLPRHGYPDPTRVELLRHCGRES